MRGVELSDVLIFAMLGVISLLVLFVLHTHERKQQRTIDQARDREAALLVFYQQRELKQATTINELRREVRLLKEEMARMKR